jgi:cobaltochelatase CobT
VTPGQAASRLQERVEALCAASIRALAGERQLAFRGRRLHRDGVALPAFAPHLHPVLEHDDFASFRGAADGLALRLLESDAALHTQLQPDDAVERLLFGWMEQFRCESLVPDTLPGMRANLQHRHEAWSTGFVQAGHAEGDSGLFLFAAAQMARAQVCGAAVPEAFEGMLEAPRFVLAPRIGLALAGMRRTRGDQAAFAQHALALAKAVAALLRAAGAGGDDPSKDSTARDAAARAAFGLLMDPVEGAANERFATAVHGATRALADGAADYRVFSSAWDREDAAASLVRADALTAQRAQLDKRIAAQGVNVGRLSRDLRALFAVPVHDGWDGAQEEGLIDGRSLARLVASPTERRLFRNERRQPVADCALSFLIDCSGSMKTHAEDVAVLVDLFARALDDAGADCEVLGFTTAAWNGGRARRAWLAAGKPPQAGRLNERQHLVFKPFETPWRRARRGVAALLKNDLFREGLDGEAVEWAAARLLQRDARSRVLVVISDGSPMDSATALANGAQYLDRHLATVVRRIERSGAIAVHALGVGLDLSPWYRSSHVLDLDARIGNAMFAEVLALLTRSRR